MIKAILVKRPALVVTTWLNCQGSRLRKLRLYYFCCQKLMFLKMYSCSHPKLCALSQNTDHLQNEHRVSSPVDVSLYKQHIAQFIVASSKAQHYVKKSCTTTKILPNTSKFYVDFKKNFWKDRKNCYVPSFSRCLAPGQTNLCAKSPPISIVSRLNRMRNFNGRHFFHTRLFPYCSNAWFPKYCGKRALYSLEKSWEVTQHRVPSCGRHLGKLDDVTIYPVLVVARTVSIIITSRGVIVARYDLILDQSVRALLYNHLSNYTKS